MPETKDKSTPAAAASPDARSLKIGERATVRVADGLRLINNETGQPFGKEPETVTVTVTTLRRLADGDLILV